METISNKEKLLRVYQALNNIAVGGGGNVKTLAGVFSILEDVITDLGNAENIEDSKDGEADSE